MPKFQASLPPLPKVVRRAERRKYHPSSILNICAARLRSSFHAHHNGEDGQPLHRAGGLGFALGVMKIFSLRQPPKIQSIWRAVLAGVVAHPLFIVLLGAVYWVLRPFVWAAIYSEAYRAPVGPYPPDSGEWLISQGIGFGASVAAGAAAAYWSPRSSWLPIALLTGLCFGSLLFTQFPLDTSVFRNAVYALHAPVGLVIGAACLWRWQPVRVSI